MRNFVDTIKKGNEEYDIRDVRVPESAIADAGKVVKVADDGSYELGEAGGGEPEYREVDISHEDASSTIAELVEELGSSFYDYVNIKYTYKHPTYGYVAQKSQKCILKLGSSGPNTYHLEAAHIQTNVKGDTYPYAMVVFYAVGDQLQETDALENALSNKGTLRELNAKDFLPQANWGVKEKFIRVNNDGSGYEFVDVLPALPSDASSKTYVLKAINGTIEWVEEQA